MSGSAAGRPPLVLALLRTAAQILEARQPQRLAQFTGPDSRRYHARFDWPGVVIVTDYNGGQELVRSVPGRPTEPEQRQGPPLRPVK